MARQSYQRNACDVLEMTFTSRFWNTASWWARNRCENRCSLFLLAVSDFKRFDTSFYFIITKFTTGLETSGKGQPRYEFSRVYIKLYKQLLINYGQLEIHTVSFDKVRLKAEAGSIL